MTRVVRIRGLTEAHLDELQDFYAVNPMQATSTSGTLGHALELAVKVARDLRAHEDHVKLRMSSPEKQLEAFRRCHKAHSAPNRVVDLVPTPRSWDCGTGSNCGSDNCVAHGGIGGDA